MRSKKKSDADIERMLNTLRRIMEKGSPEIKKTAQVTIQAWAKTAKVASLLVLGLETFLCSVFIMQ